MFSAAALYRGHRFPAEVISHAVWLYFRFNLSHHEVEKLLAERGIRVGYEAIRLWCRKFGVAGHMKAASRGRGKSGQLRQAFQHLRSIRSEVSMGDYLKMPDKRRVLALLELGWSYRTRADQKADPHRLAGDRGPGHAASAAHRGRGPARNLHPPI